MKISKAVPPKQFQSLRFHYTAHVSWNLHTEMIGLCKKKKEMYTEELKDSKELSNTSR
jgi:hypothetical protein